MTTRFFSLTIIFIIVIVLFASSLEGRKSSSSKKKTKPDKKQTYYSHNGEVVIRIPVEKFNKSSIETLAEKHGYRILGEMKHIHHPEKYVYVKLMKQQLLSKHHGLDEYDVLKRSYQLHSDLLDDIEWGQPQVLRQHHTRSKSKDKKRQKKKNNNNNNNKREDPLYSSQWHLRGDGIGFQHVHVDAKGAWDLGYKGKGITIGIVDDGVQYNHADLKTNYLSNVSFNYNDGLETNPDAVPNNGDYHGTCVAGVVAASDNDGVCGVGVAYEANFGAIRLISGPVSDWQEASALSHAYEEIDIYSNSWGPEDSGHHVVKPGYLTRQTFRTMMETGRNGSGTIYVWAAGNGRTSSDDCNYDGYANSRFTIAVGAVGANGRYAPYSEPCAALLVCAPSSGSGSHGIVTTDLTGQDGYRNGDCNTRFGGTSAAAPVVSGVVALMLHANPELGWRDVQHILMRTATRVDSGSRSWLRNSVGNHYSHDYGFGLANAKEAVKKSKDWINIASTTTPYIGTRKLTNHQIKDDGSINEFVEHITSDFKVEYVELEVDITHEHRGELRIRLYSPSGTEAKLAELRTDRGADYKRWVFGATCFWGESANGDWTIQVRDRLRGNKGVMNSWRLNVFGYDVDEN